MKTIKIATLIIAGLVSAFSAQAQEPLKFDKIRVTGPASVELKQGDVAAIIIEDSDVSMNIRNIASTTEDGWLVINGSADDIIVTAPSLTKIDISGSGKLESIGVFKSGDIELHVTGAGKMEMNLDAKKVKGVITGAGKIELEGTGDDLHVVISGAGKVDGENFKVKTCTATITGNGKCLVDVTDELTANITGNGSIYYVTKPLKINNNVTGLGKIADANSVEQDTTRITLGKKKVLIIDSEGKNVRIGFKDTVYAEPQVKGHWAGFEMGVTMLMNDDFKNEAPEGYGFLDQKVEKSIALHFNLADYELNLYRKNIMLITGIGFSFNNYRFNSDAYLLPQQDSVVAYDDPANTLKKNKLVASYLNIPLLLEFNTSQNPDKTVHFAFGVIGGLRLGTHLKMIKKVDGDEAKSKVFDDFNLNQFRYDATVRLGYRNATLFASYSLAELFKDNRGPELHPLTLGIRLVGW